MLLFAVLSRSLNGGLGSPSGGGGFGAPFFCRSFKAATSPAAPGLVPAAAPAPAVSVRAKDRGKAGALVRACRPARRHCSSLPPSCREDIRMLGEGHESVMRLFRRRLPGDGGLQDLHGGLIDRSATRMRPVDQDLARTAHRFDFAFRIVADLHADRAAEGQTVFLKAGRLFHDWSPLSR